MTVPVDPAWVGLSLVGRLGSKTLRALLNEFGSTEAILRADKQALKQVKGVGDGIADAIIRLNLSRIRAQMDQWQAQGVRIVPMQSPDYPAMLYGLLDEPPTLFVRGAYQPTLWHKTVAIVGTRQPTQPGHQQALRLATQAASAGYTVVSGLALGIDAAAHEGALQVAAGRTLAVLGSGVLNVYPPQHHRLAGRIVARGALIGENHPYAEAIAPRLVSRNRIITGVSQHIVIVESALEGGAMHAARFAVQQGRQLYALDFPAAGNQHLLREGAHPIPPDWRDLPFA